MVLIKKETGIKWVGGLQVTCYGIQKILWPARMIPMPDVVSLAATNTYLVYCPRFSD
jgi:hypothetical protein